MSTASTDAPETAAPPAPPAVQAVPAKPAPAPPKLDRLPPWNVLLHNDDVNYLEDVVETIVMLGISNRRTAILRALEAHSKGVSLLLSTHRERAELVQEQLSSRRLTVTIEPA